MFILKKIKGPYLSIRWVLWISTFSSRSTKKMPHLGLLPRAWRGIRKVVRTLGRQEKIFHKIHNKPMECQELSQETSCCDIQLCILNTANI